MRLDVSRAHNFGRIAGAGSVKGRDVRCCLTTWALGGTCESIGMAMNAHVRGFKLKVQCGKSRREHTHTHKHRTHTAQSTQQPACSTQHSETRRDIISYEKYDISKVLLFQILYYRYRIQYYQVASTAEILFRLLYCILHCTCTALLVLSIYLTI